VARNATMWYQSNLVELLVMGTLQSGIRAVKKRRVLCIVAQSGWMGTLQSGIKAVKKKSFVQRGPAWVAGNITKWYQSPVFNIEPGWAELAER
jgi:hypothetical protein